MAPIRNPNRYEQALDPEALQMFCAVTETGSFTRGAARVFRSQPTVSARIQTLERELGLPLLDRSGGGVRPTPAGKVLYGYAKRLLSLRSEAAQVIRKRLGVLEGELSAGASTIPGTFVLPRLVARFQAEHPDVRSRLVMGDTGAMIEAVLSRRVDLAVVGDRPVAAKVQARAWGNDEIVLAAPPSMRALRDRREIDLAELRELPLILREAGSGTRRVVDRALERRGFSPGRDGRVVCELGSTESIREAVKAGLGAAFLSAVAVRDPVHAGQLLQLKIRGVDLTRPFYLVRLERAFASPLAEVFWKFLIANESDKLGA